ncbi:MAG: tryptophan synthase subunit alpha [Pseudonocardiales bacterium]|nr:MAG: tryptophan synthase subunit alpha [Pseudonocardiales bacterium]
MGTRETGRAETGRLETGRVERVLDRARTAGRPSLVSYVTAGVRADWTDLLAAMIEAGADAVEIGLPFSDPMLDGPVIQQASGAAIGRGANTTAILAELRRARPRAGQDGEVPLIAMSYANHAYHRGIARYCDELAGAGFSGTIIPDLPAGEADEYLAAAAASGLDATLMVTPATPPAQMRAIARRSRGFLYVMSVMATTGSSSERDDERRWALAARALASGPEGAGEKTVGEKQDSPRPVVIGFGIDTPARAAAAVRHADGVIVASALMRRVLDGAAAVDIGRAVGGLRAAIDAAR